MKQLFFLLLILNSACNSEHTYKYIPTERSAGLNGPKQVGMIRSFEAANDSIAYFEGYNYFAIANIIYKESKYQALEAKPISFQVLNNKNEDISLKIKIPDLLAKQLKIDSTIAAIHAKSSSASYEETKNELKLSKIDSARILELKKKYQIKTDEFSVNHETWYKPKSRPSYINRNGFFCQFMTNNGVAENMRFIMQYFANDWLFIKSVSFSIDGHAFQYEPGHVETDSGDGKIWEWFNDPVGSYNIELIEALCTAKSAKMKLIGRQYSEVRIISTEQLKSIKETVELYKLLGGKF